MLNWPDLDAHGTSIAENMNSRSLTTTIKWLQCKSTGTKTRDNFLFIKKLSLVLVPVDLHCSHLIVVVNDRLFIFSAILVPCASKSGQFNITRHASRGS